MAIIEKREVILDKDLKGIYLKNFILGIITILFLGVYKPLALFSFIFFILSINTQIRKIDKNALKNESCVKNIFSELNDEYHVFNNTTVEIKGKRTKLGTIIVGDNGVFIIEIKNIKGDISGDINDHNLLIEKRGIRGVKYYRSFYNPYKRVNTKVDVFSKYLKMNNIKCHITGLVFLNYRDKIIFRKNSINIKNSDGLIFDNSNELLIKIKSENIICTDEEKKGVIWAINISKYL